MIDKIWLSTPTTIGLGVLIVQPILHGIDAFFIGAIALFWGLVASGFSAWLFPRMKTRRGSYVLTSLVVFSGYVLAWVSFLVFVHLTGFYL
ncbi:MAG: hypothetical protein HOP33_14790 [Verrucomicrobia bacterium]|nr:hypothetical protein [Verrucomicrobiota bacterium]